MLVVMHSAIQNMYKKKKISLAKLKLLGVSPCIKNTKKVARDNNFSLEETDSQHVKLDILVITQHEVGILIGVEYGEKTSQSVLEKMVYNDWYKAFYGDLCSRYTVQKMCLVGVSFDSHNSMTSVSYLFNSFDLSFSKTIRVSLPS